MIGRFRVVLSRAVMDASARGNPLARWLNARATRRYIANLPPHSPIVPGPFEIPDTDRPLPEGARNRLFGDFELMPLDPARVSAGDLVGQRLQGLQPELGSTGVNAYGFVGLSLGAGWLIVPLFGAARWITLDGRLLADPDHAAVGRSAPWMSGDADADAASDRLGGTRIAAADLGRQHMRLDLDDGGRIEIARDPARRPRMEQGDHLRAFQPEDDLSAALFLSPTPEIYSLG